MKKIFYITLIGTSLLTACASNNEPKETVVIEQETLPLREVKNKMFFIEQIKVDSLWLKTIEDKAKERSISLEEMIQIDAEYLQNEDAQIVKIENDIIRNPEWLDLVKKKAREQGASLDDVIRADANFMYQESKKATAQQ